MSRLRIVVSSAVERARSSLFAVPLLYVVVALALAAVTLWVDVSILAGDRLPAWFRTTVPSAQTLLGTIAGATITVAGITFSVTVVAVQLASSQLSPRVMRHFLRDPYQKAVIGVTVGTFSYSLVVLRATRASLGTGGEPVTPHVSVAVAVALAIGTVVAILAFIDRAARSMQAGRLVGRITDETLDVLDRIATHDDEAPADTSAPDREGFLVTSVQDGWVQQVGVEGLFDALPPGGTARLETRVGSYVQRGGPLCTVWPRPERDEDGEGGSAPSDPDDEAPGGDGPSDDERALARRVRGAVYLGSERTTQQDLEFGIRQLVDIALRALSPGVNDPTTAYEVLVHLGTIVGDILTRELPPRAIAGADGRRVLRPNELDQTDLLERAFDQVRLAGAHMPSVATALLSTLESIQDRVGLAGYPQRAALVREEARLVLDVCERADLPERDRERVRERATWAGV